MTPLSGSGYRGPGATRARGGATGDAGPGDGPGTGPGVGRARHRASSPLVASQSPSADATLTNDLAVALVPLRRRAFGDSAIRFALLAVGSWAGAVCLLLAWSKVRPTGNVAFIAGCLGAGAVLVGCTAWAVRRPGIVEVARLADARLGLDERLASALCFAGAPGDMEARLRADAARAALRHKPAEAFPLGRHQRLAITATVAGLVAVTLAVTPNPQASALARRAADEAVVTQAATGSGSRRKTTRQPDLSTGPAAFLGSAEGPVTARQGGYAHRLVGGIVRPFPAARRHGQLIRYSRAGGGSGRRGCRGHPGRAPGAANVARDLSSANLNAAAAGLRTLANELPQLTQAQRTALAAALARAASAAGSQAGNSEAGSSAPAGAGSNEGFATAIGKASAALLAGHIGAASKDLGAAASGAAASQAAVSLQQQLGVIQAAVQNEAARAASQAQADIGSAGRTASVHSAVGRAGPGGLSAGSTPGAASQSGAGSAGSTGLGSGGSGGLGGAGSGGSGSGGGGSGGGGSANTGGASTGAAGSDGASIGGASSELGRAGANGSRSTSQGGPGNGTEAARKAEQAGQASAGATQVYVAGQPGNGEQVVGEQLGEGGRVKTTSYQSVLPRFTKTALQDLNSNVVSPNDQNLVRSYFSSLGSGR